MKKAFIVLLTITLTGLIYLSFGNRVSAAGCEPIYGGGDNCPSSNIDISKMVLNPQTNNFVDNLGMADPFYQSGDSVNFQIKVINKTNTTISKINLKDVFPKYLLFSDGPGNFDFNTNTLSFDANNLRPNQTQTFSVIGKVVMASQLPNDKSNICMVNLVTAKAVNGNQVQASTQFCVQNAGAGLTGTTNTTPTPSTSVSTPIGSINSTPKTGVENWTFIALITSGALGYLIRKIAIKI